ncbi:GNAT family N-acetyltransferase [Luteibaculum oceani]|uniref:GNAT family N-acetyltransferase n=1 Tax=Luteibaculum oceani TaxID=1294296 RepID=A0A5C6UQM2_9FLAO|nr:hypothetical protein [Luteibaculum oceani]TXC75642.1 hypothetical protein FRX97_11735 [Luteibaculum oceani]
MTSTLFSTERCIVKPLQKEDFPEILEMYQELDSNKYVPPLKDKTPEEHLAFLELKIGNNEKELGFWTARKKRKAVW